MPDTAKLDPAIAALKSMAGGFVPDAGLFASGTAPIDAEQLTEDLLEDLRRHVGEARENPFANPVQLLALDLSRRIADGRLDYAALEQLVQFLTVDGFLDRARRLGSYVGETDPEANADRLSALFRGLAAPRGAEETGEAGGEIVRFDLFRRRVEEEVFGIVFTAHPTFNLSGGLMHALATLAAGRDDDGRPLDDAARARLVDAARRAEHRPDRPLDLNREHALSLQAIAHAQEALRRAYGILFDVAREIYPDRWRELTPRLMTVASWVGYDLDGRSDIGWTMTLNKRMRIQHGQIRHYLEEVRRLRADAAAAPDDRAADGLGDVLELMESRLALAENQVGSELDVFDRIDPHAPTGPSELAQVSRRMYEGLGMRLADAGALIELADRAIARVAETRPAKGRRKAATADAIARRLAVLRAELANCGLGMAHTHLRVNAAQVHNAIRQSINLVSSPNDPRYRVSYLESINQLLEGVRPVRVNFGSVLAERTSVKQMFMIVAQMLKYTGRTAPIRFLIAESESAFTVLVALYFAKLYGVDDHLDLSPLFETERALEAGSRVIDQLLKNPHFRAYVEKRGRLCVETGYSDAGRFIGQTPANASIERLRLRLIRVMAKHGLGHVRLVIFDTHGESIGRGAHPQSMDQRLANIDTPATRAFMVDQGVAFKQEMSFQGGDGYLPFVNRTMAFATVTRLLEHALETGHSSADDPFYDEDAYIREFFTTVKEFQVSLMEDKGYGVLLGGFGVNLLFPSGSRALKRQHEDPTDIDHASARQLRAIPHNAVLQQLGLLANSLGGVGAAIAKDPDKFRDLYSRSPRLRQLMGIVEYALAVSDPRAMDAYIDTVDPGFWIVRAGHAGDGEMREDMLSLASYHEDSRIAEHQAKVFRRLHRDWIVLRDELGRVADGSSSCGALVDARCKDSLNLLHAVRIAIIQQIFLLAMRTPEFSGRHGTSPQELIARLLHLDVDTACAHLEEIFPMTESAVDFADFGEPADLQEDQAQSYRYENEHLFRPMENLHQLVKRISTAVTHRIGFFG